MCSLAFALLGTRSDLNYICFYQKGSVPASAILGTRSVPIYSTSSESYQKELINPFSNVSILGIFLKIGSGEGGTKDLKGGRGFFLKQLPEWY